MSIIRKVFMSIIHCGFVGALGAGVLAVCVYIVVDVLLPHDTDEVKAWKEFGLIMVGLGSILVGFALGGIYGAIRTLTGLKSRTVLIAMSVLYVTIYLIIALCIVFT